MRSWKRPLGYVYVVFGVLIMAQVLTRTHDPHQMFPGVLLGAAFAALGVLRLRSRAA